jgi:hypothetical protein
MDVSKFSSQQFSPEEWQPVQIWHEAVRAAELVWNMQWATKLGVATVNKSRVIHSLVNNSADIEQADNINIWKG